MFFNYLKLFYLDMWPERVTSGRHYFLYISFHMVDDQPKNNIQGDEDHQNNAGLSLDDNNAPQNKTQDPDPTGGHIPDDIFKAPEEEEADIQAGNPAPADPQSKPAATHAQSAPPPKPGGAAKAPAGKKKFSFKSGGLGSKSDTPAKPEAKAGAAPAKGSNVPRGALNAVVTRNEYYRDGYRNLMKVAFIEGVIIIGLVFAFIVYMNIHQERNIYFATTADGRILQLVPLDQPNISESALMSWVAQAATETMTFGFHDYQRRLQNSSRHFTRRGWESFTQALQRSRIIESVESLQQVVTATPRSAPVLLQQGVFDGRYRWIVRLPLTVTFTSGNKTTSSNLEVTITIERVPTLESPNGVGIESWIAVG